MADVTAGGKPVDEKSKSLERRRKELRLQELAFNISKNEVRVLELQNQIEREEEGIQSLKDQLQLQQQELEEEE